MKQNRNSVTLKLLLISLMLSSTLVACNTTSVYVLDKEELVKVKKGDIVTVQFEEGWLLSKRAVERVMNARVEKEKLR